MSDEPQYKVTMRFGYHITDHRTVHIPPPPSIDVNEVMEAFDREQRRGDNWQLVAVLLAGGVFFILWAAARASA